MASRKTHLEVDAALFEGRTYNEVHRILDQFAHFPDEAFLAEHRKFLHHEEGVAYIRMRFGDEAAKAAEAHCVVDMGHVPKAIHYYDGTVNTYGYKTHLLQADDVAELDK